MDQRIANTSGDSEKPQMQDRQRFLMAGICCALAHPTCIAIVELLRDEGEISATFLYDRIEADASSISQHLTVLRAKHLVQTRNDKNQVFYSLCDKVLGRVLDLMGHYFRSHLTESFEILKQVRSELPAE